MAETSPPEPNLHEIGAEVEAILESLRAAPDPTVHERVERIVRLLVRLYGTGLERIVGVVNRDAAGGDGLLARLAEDDLVASLLVLHDLHPLPTEARVRQALERVRNEVGRVEIVGTHGLAADGTLHLRLEGIERGFPASPFTAREIVERAIEQAAPEVARIEIEGVPGPLPPGSQFIPLTAVHGVHR